MVFCPIFINFLQSPGIPVETKILLKDFCVKNSSGLVKCSFDNPANYIAPNFPTISPQFLSFFGISYSSQTNSFQAIYFLVHIHCSSDKHAQIFPTRIQRVSVGSLKLIMEFSEEKFSIKWIVWTRRITFCKLCR